jgi:hypothetical protein
MCCVDVFNSKCLVTAHRQQPVTDMLQAQLHPVTIALPLAMPNAWFVMLLKGCCHSPGSSMISSLSRAQAAVGSTEKSCLCCSFSCTGQLHWSTQPARQLASCSNGSGRRSWRSPDALHDLSCLQVAQAPRVQRNARRSCRHSYAPGAFMSAEGAAEKCDSQEPEQQLQQHLHCQERI